MPRLRTCAHCGQTCGDYAGGTASLTRDGRTVDLCHPNDPGRPDCYERVTVWHEPLGSLNTRAPRPAGVSEIRSRVYGSMEELLADMDL